MRNKLCGEIPFYHTPETVAQIGSILTHADGYQWLMENYVTTYFQITNTSALVEGFLDVEKFWDCPFVAYSSVFRNDILKANIKITDFFKQLILSGNNILLLLNHYYVKTTSIYQKKHLGHTALLSGYDVDTNQFLYSDFSGRHNSQYKFFDIDEEELFMAATKCDPNIFDYNHSPFASYFQEQYFERIQYFKINPAIPYQFHLASLIGQLKCYLSGSPPMQITYFPVGFHIRNSAWGTGMFAAFRDYLERAAAQRYKWKDIRRFVYFLGCIRKLMDMRIDFINEKYDLANYALLKAKNKELSDIQDSLLKIVVIHTLREQEIDGKELDYFQETLTAYENGEKVLLQDLISILERING